MGDLCDLRYVHSTEIRYDLVREPMKVFGARISEFFQPIVHFQGLGSEVTSSSFF